MTMLNFTIGDAIPLSNVTVLAGGLTSVFLIYKEKDPLDKNILLIDYKLSSFIIPIISAGTMVGVIVVKILPPILLLTILIIYVIYASNNVIKKAI